MTLRLITAGESHGPTLTCILEGLPAGLTLDRDALNRDLARRQLGHGRGGRMKIERDQVTVTGGVRHGRTLGGPIALEVVNRDYANWEERMNPWPVHTAVGEVHLPRPGHADLVGTQKFGLTDVRDILERASARETAARVAGGAVAKALLSQLGVGVFSHVIQIASVTAPRPDDPRPADFAHVDESPVRCLDAAASKAMVAEIDRLRKANESLGGVFEVRAFGLVPGLGSHVSWDERLDGRLAQATMSIQAIKAVAIGDAVEVAGLPGSQAHDEIFYRDAGGFYRQTNRAGGLEGGMTNGEPLVVRGFMKPLPTLTKPLRSVDIATHEPADGVARADRLVHGAGGRRGRRGDGRLRARRRIPAQVRRRSHRRRLRGGASLRGADRVAPALTLPAGRKLVLIGFMGAGKSTAAAGVAEALGLDAIDVDAADRAVARQADRARVRAGRRGGVPRGRGTRHARAAAGSRRLRPVAGRGRDRLGCGSRRAVAITSRSGSTRTLTRRGRGAPPAAGRWRRRARHSQRSMALGSRSTRSSPTSSCQVSDQQRSGPCSPHSMVSRPTRSCCGPTSASGDYAAYVGPGLLSERFWPPAIEGRRFLVSDGNVARLYGDALAPLTGRVAIMPGEQSKTVAHAEIVWTELARAGLTRQDLVIALGGGVVGDLAGFCAATYQRGVRYVQVPTSLVAQVDSAYGGKTGVDLEEAKNYVGSYHQPSAVIADPDALATLPAAELAAGYAEVVKTALIAGGWLWERIRGGADPATPELIAGCVQAKLRIVARDERDAGIRQVLNLGHTVAHAIETVTGYARYRHGEAVGLGLLAALRLSGRDELRAEVRELLGARALPTSLDGTDPDAIVVATARDKKRVGEGPVPFVLLDAPGAARPGCRVQSRELIAAVRELAT